MAQAYRPWLTPSFNLVGLALGLAGCQSTAGPAAYAPPYPAYDYSAIAPAAGPQQAPAYAPPVPYQALEASSLELKERLERVEKAMLRLDRRMQLVERNELSRMGSQTSQSDINTNEEQAAMRALNIGPGQSALTFAQQGTGANSANDYRPVASRNEGITSALQAAPSLSAASSSGYTTPDAGVQVATRNGLPSLADPAPAASRSLQTGTADVAIWTVKYDANKVWPERDQLPSSRDVVETLRRSSAGSGSVTLYARGKNANAVEFRERVKALSRYLSKVSSLDSVPIAAMVAPHLDDQTIEILATH